MMPNEKKKGAASGGARLPEGKKQMLIIMDQELIKDVKKAAIDDNEKMSHVMEEAAREWLARWKARRGV
jgi:hypothetical protein